MLQRQLAKKKKGSNRRNNKITEVYYFRKIPENLGGYMVAAGLEQVISFIKNFSSLLSMRIKTIYP